MALPSTGRFAFMGVIVALFCHNCAAPKRCNLCNPAPEAPSPTWRSAPQESQFPPTALCERSISFRKLFARDSQFTRLCAGCVRLRCGLVRPPKQEFHRAQVANEHLSFLVRQPESQRSVTQSGCFFDLGLLRFRPSFLTTQFRSASLFPSAARTFSPHLRDPTPTGCI